MSLFLGFLAVFDVAITAVCNLIMSFLNVSEFVQPKKATPELQGLTRAIMTEEKLSSGFLVKKEGIELSQSQ